MGYIYIATNKINGKSYIGQTIRSIKERLKEHRTKSGCRGIFGAIKKHGWKNFKVDWYECSDDELNKHEKWMVNLMGTLSPNGYNLKDGGSRGKMSEESKQKLRKANRGKKLGEEHKQKIGKAHLGTKQNEKTKQKISESLLGEKHPMSKRVYQYDLDGTCINSFGSSEEAGRHLEKDGSKIRHCARGSRKTAYKFKWSYTMDIFI